MMVFKKKKVVFIIPSLHSGGAERSLINLLNVFDYTKFDVDLFVFKKSGIFLQRLPKQVNLLDYSQNYITFSLPLHKSCFQFLKRFQFSLIGHRILFTIKNKLYPVDKAEQYGWKHVAKGIGVFQKKYDISIGHLEKSSIYCSIDLVNSDRKIGFIRRYYDLNEFDKNFDEGYFTKLDFLCSNGKLSQDRLEEIFPHFKSKIRLVENVTLPSQIIENSKELKPLDELKVNLLTVGRLHPLKGYDWAIEACKILVEKNTQVVWYVIGEGSEREKMELMIKEYNLEKNFILLGEKENPYTYMAQCSIYIQPSVDEAKCNTLNEAKILKRPIIATNFTTVHDQLINEFNGLIVEKNPQEIANAVSRLLEDDKLKLKLTNNLNTNVLGSENELKRFYELLD
jgi:glycosyltransferase involved in cell wall biosynthesis